MDVVNGRIVETAVRAADRGEARAVAMDPNQAWRGFVADGDVGVGVGGGESDSTGSGALGQHEPGERLGPGGVREWAPSWAPSSFFGDERTTSVPALPAVQAGRNRCHTRQVELDRSGRAGDFTGLQPAPVADHRPGWNRRCGPIDAGLWGARVDTGQGAELARPGSEAVDHALGLKPSRALVEDATNGRRQKLCFRGSRDQPSGSFAPAAPSWAGGLSRNFSDQPMASWSRHGLAPASAPGRLISDFSKPRGYGFPGFQQQQQMHDGHRQGWKRSHTASSSGALWSSDQCHHHFDRTPCSEGKLDEEMTLLESQITRTVSGHFSDLASSLAQELPPSAKEGAAAAPAVEANDAAVSADEDRTVKPSELNCTRASQPPDGVAQGEFGRIMQPLRLLLRKALTVSDVGELGRIVVPKKDAESPLFPKIDTKEGAVLGMDDHVALKRWYFRFKYWINNKSRMYVLENTGDFIKYHSLKENDTFIVCEDDCKNLVVCGQKKGAIGGDNWDPSLESSASQTQSSPKTKAGATIVSPYLHRHQHG